MLCTPTSNALFFADIDKVPSKIWEELSANNIYLNYTYLKALQKNHTEIDFYYIVLKDEKQEALALAIIQVVDLYVNSVKDTYRSIVKNIQKFGKKLHLLKNEEKLTVLICGNTFISGEHGIKFKSNKSKKQVFNKLVEAISQLVESTKSLKKTVDIFLLKDFINKSLSSSNTLEKYNYHPFSVDPNMVLDLSKNWQIFDDYLASMKTKFRVKAKRALTLSEPLKVVKITQENFESQITIIDQLYSSVADNSSFNLVNFNSQTYKDFITNFNQDYILQTYWLADKMVGFISGLINENSLDAHFVGIDYNVNKQYAIYQRMLYDYVAIGIQKNLETINFGRTASEIKSSIGAVPEELTMYVRHKKTIPNKLLKLFLQKIEPIPFKQKQPFKQIVD